MSLYCIADPHLSEFMKKPMDVFGSRWVGHREKFLNGWKNTVTDEDTVVIPGDISWAMTLEKALPDLKLINSLPGKKILLRGNHDYWWQSVSKIRNALGECSTVIIQNDSVMVEGFAVCGTRGWFPDSKKAPSGTDYIKLTEREALRLGMSLEHAEKNFCGEFSEKIVFLHFPPVYRGLIMDPIVNVMLEHNVKRCFYGHIHNVYDMPGTFEYKGIELTLVSADFLNFVPLEIKANESGA
ncbi:MAG: metallophosphoesterase [Clostridia bacterium]|nr:metallophosphoesterase [Clostridia bacterium]